MFPIKQKLQSNRGASMIMAMVFLLFCLLIGGSVLATATANGSRIENMTQNQQEYYSQRSAMLLMSDLLLGEDGQELQVVVTDVTVTQAGAAPKHTIHFSSPNLPANASHLQKTLLEVVVASYRQRGVTLRYPDFDWINLNNSAPASGNIYMRCDIDPSDILEVCYAIQAGAGQDYSLALDFGENQSHFILTMDGAVSTGTPNTVTVDNAKTTTTTTVIRWSLPDIQKGKYTATGGNEA